MMIGGVEENGEDVFNLLSKLWLKASCENKMIDLKINLRVGENTLKERFTEATILESGCRKIRISPKLGDLEWINISFPTPYGLVKLSAEKNDGKVHFRVDAPSEVEIVR